jgi:hypothetical protein
VAFIVSFTNAGEKAGKRGQSGDPVRSLTPLVMRVCGQNEGPKDFWFLDC